MGLLSFVCSTLFVYKWLANTVAMPLENKVSGLHIGQGKLLVARFKLYMRQCWIGHSLDEKQKILGAQEQQTRAANTKLQACHRSGMKKTGGHFLLGGTTPNVLQS